MLETYISCITFDFGKFDRVNNPPPLFTPGASVYQLWVALLSNMLVDPKLNLVLFIIKLYIEMSSKLHRQ